MTQPGRDALAHLARDWEAQAAQLERLPELPGYLGRGERRRHALVLRDCASQLLELLSPGHRRGVLDALQDQEPAG